MSKTYNLAVMGATSPGGEALLRQLEARAFPIASITLLTTAESATHDSEDGEAQTTLFMGKNQLHENIDEFDFLQVDMVFFCNTDNQQVQQLERALAADCYVIELGSNLFNTETVFASYSVDGINAQQHHYCSAPGSAVVLAELLKPIDDAATIQQLNISVLLSVSAKGKSGINELAHQTTCLLNARPVKAKVFPQQIAFNVFPHDGMMDVSGYTDEENILIQALRGILNPATGLAVSLIYMPVFYGAGFDVNLKTEQPIDTQQIESILQTNSMIKVKPAEDFITPVTHASESAEISVNRIRQIPGQPQHLNLWCVAEFERAGNARNSVQIAEILVKHHL